MPIQRYKFDGVDIVKNANGRWVKYEDYEQEEREIFERLIHLALYCRPEIMVLIPQETVLTNIFLVSAEIYIYLLKFEEVIKNIYGKESAIYQVIIQETKGIIAMTPEEKLKVENEDLIKVYNSLKEALEEIETKYSKSVKA